MSNESVTKEDKTLYERHANTILNVLAAALLIWVGNTLIDNTKAVAVINERVVTLNRAVDELKAIVNNGNKDRYTSREASVDRKQLVYMIEQLDKRIITLETNHRK